MACNLFWLAQYLQANQTVCNNNAITRKSASTGAVAPRHVFPQQSRNRAQFVYLSAFATV
eukprot:6463783-Amphidinium_carterae.1